MDNEHQPLITSAQVDSTSTARGAGANTNAHAGVNRRYSALEEGQQWYLPDGPIRRTSPRVGVGVGVGVGVRVEGDPRLRTLSPSFAQHQGSVFSSSNRATSATTTTTPSPRRESWAATPTHATDVLVNEKRACKDVIIGCAPLSLSSSSAAAAAAERGGGGGGGGRGGGDDDVMPGGRCPDSAHHESTALLADGSSKATTRAYPARWYVLWLFCMTNMMQGIGWGTFGPITQSCKAVFGWHDNNIAFMGLGANVFFVVCCLPFSWLMERKGLRVAILASTALMAVGFGIRCASMHAPLATWTMTIGQILIGGGAVVPFSGVSLLSSLWFPLHQRTTATSVATVFGFLGVSLGFIIGPLAVPEGSADNSNISSSFLDTSSSLHHIENSSLIQEQRHAIAALMYSEAGATALILFLLVIYFPAKPPTPPTLSAHVERLDIIKGLRSLFRNGQFILVVLAFSIGTGIYGAFGIILDIDVQPIGVSQTTAGWMGFYGTVGGCAAGFFASWLSDRFVRQLKCLLLLMMIPTVGVLVWFCLLVGKYIPFNEASLYVVTVASGTSLLAVVPLFYEFACEASYPMGEGATVLSLTLAYNVMGSVLLVVLSIAQELDVIWMNYILTASVTIGIAFLLVSNVRYRRTNLDLQMTFDPPTARRADKSEADAPLERETRAAHQALPSTEPGDFSCLTIGRQPLDQRLFPWMMAGVSVPGQAQMRKFKECR